MNRMFEVSTAMKSPRGFLRPPFSGTFNMEPSTILSNGACTPSPETSRVMETFCDARQLIDLVHVHDAVLRGAYMSKSALTSSL